jgi:hypothetical protein
MDGDRHEPPSRGPRVRGAVRHELRAALELSALVGFAVVQPVLGPFGESPETFTAVGAGPGQIATFAVLVAVVPVVGLWGLAALSRLFGAGVRASVQTALVAVLAGVAAVALARHVGAGAWTRSAAALAAAALAAMAHRRWEPARLFLRYASPVPVLLVGAFLFASPVAPLVRPTTSTPEATGGGDHPPVVVIVLDELPTLSLLDGNGGIDADLVPNLDRLADTSTWYRDHTSVSPSTLASMPALLTGRRSTTLEFGRGPTHADHPDNLLAVLGRTHDVNAVEWATALCPPDVCRQEARSVDREARALLDRPLRASPHPLGLLVTEARSLWWSQAWPAAADSGRDFLLAGFDRGDDLTRVVLDFLVALDRDDPDAGDRPTFDYLHAPLPHIPWLTLPSGDVYDAPRSPFGAETLGFLPRGDLGDQLGAAARSRHLLQLQWTDRLLGVIIDRLQELDRWDDAVVVVTADHGIAFSDSLRYVRPANQVEVAWTPLFVKAPGQRAGEVVDDDASALDVLPTILDLAGVEADPDLPGRSLVGPPPSAAPPRMFLAAEHELFDRRGEGDLVVLDADGLAAIDTAPSTGPPTDGLRVWRHGRHGALLGLSVDELGVCDGSGAVADVDLPAGWDAFAAGRSDPGDALPLWLEGTIDADGSRDVAVVVDGTVVGWAPSHPGHSSGTGNRFGVLVTAPLVDPPVGTPTFHEVVDEAGCRLRPLRT